MSNASGITWLDRFFVSAYTLDANGVGQLAATEQYTSGDPNVTIRGKYGSALTTLSTATVIPLPWAVASGSVWAFEIYVTCKGTGVRRKIKISAIVWGNGSTATIDGTPDVDAKGTGTPTASITVSGSAAQLTITPGTAAAYTWGYEIRGQQL